jgi:hypothetical protein
VPILIILFRPQGENNKEDPDYRTSHGISVVVTLIIGAFVCLTAIFGMIAAGLNRIKCLLVCSAVFTMLDAIATFCGGVLILLVYGPIAVAVLFFVVGSILALTFTITVYLSYQTHNRMAYDKNTGYVTHTPLPNVNGVVQSPSAPSPNYVA